MADWNITPEELKRRLDSGEKLEIIDVREPEEWALANIGGKLIPLGEITMRFEEIDRDKEVIVLCHHGVRSAHAVAFLRGLGFEQIKNLAGGIDRWSVQVDPTTPRY